MKPVKILNGLGLVLIYFISIMPFPILYLFSDALFVFLFYAWRYRKNIVFENLKASFPDKTDRELKAIRWFFYRYLCDLFLETLKMLTISSRSLIRRCNLESESRELLDQLYQEKKSAIVTLGHKGNWEWAGTAFSLLCQQPIYIVYHPLSNSRFDRVMQQMRSRFGAKLTTMSNAYKTLKQVGNEPILSAFVADQSPPPATAQWTEFLNQETAFFKGPEKISSKLGHTVVYLSIRRVSRGYYTMHVDKLAEHSEHLTEGTVTEKYVEALEKDILDEPVTWLWSHRRWKHKKQAS